MGQWNTLHLFDEEIFYSKIVDSFKNDKPFLDQYFNSKFNPYLIEDPETLKKERLEEVMRISKKMSTDFKNHPNILSHRNQPNFSQKFYSQELMDFRDLLFIAVFSNCALSFPYFKLGYRLMISYLDFYDEKTETEMLMDKIKYNKNKGGVFPGETGIRNWISKNEVIKILDTFDNVRPKLSNIENSNHNRFAKTYTEEFKEYFKIARDHGFGLISCLDAPLELFKNSQPIGKSIEWEKYNLKENLIKS